ncbi:protease inhibitor I42 family protein [Streptomyces sp. ISL-96]|uniref:protease inhibitor I42 family protein n=1 Tax=Streptomyces sp. ISL-96 TaxID=2819191 RepID=UPI001BE9746B|nr:protease inhibitor I42 family protein [Streptomyces sp. ISL-96]MBT2489957.1 protease inhibitor I42 family protein [Streptomyces sp. ISL-96]
MNGSDMRHRLAAAFALTLSALALAGCGLFGPEAYETDERSIEVDAGEDFRLTVPASPGMGQNWYLATPHPDDDVVRLTGQDEETEGSDLDGGAKGTQFFDFKAVEPGTTKIKLLHCPLGRCGGEFGDPAPSPSTSPFPTATATPGLDPEYFIYTVTVR